MRPRVPFLVISVLFVLAFSCSADEVDFATQVQPLLAKRCYACHGPDAQEGGLRFDQRDSLLHSTDSGEVPLVPGVADKSDIIKRVSSSDPSDRMPPEGKPLSPSEITTLRSWINSGAVYTKHWSFQPIQNPTPPTVKQIGDAKQPLDLFVLEKLEKAGLAWTAEARPRDLIRRVYLDITGLPPSPEEVLQWSSSWNDDSYARLIHQLLSSASFGERWARMWLDVVRYAESNSYERDNPKPNAWRYRDYVIQSFNDDKPYDQFVREQIAGDELETVTPESLIATGYYRLGLWDDEPADPLQARFDEYDDIVTTTSQAFLGLTLNCARCHDHKIDPLTQRDYYAMVAFVRDVTSYGTRGDQVSNNQLDLDKQAAAQHTQTEVQIRELEAGLHKMEQEAIVKMPAPDQRATEGAGRKKVLQEKLKDFMDEATWSQYSLMKEQLAQTAMLKSSLPALDRTLGLGKIDPKPPTTYVLHRGSPQSEGEPVEPAFPELLGGGLPDLSATTEKHSAGRRRHLADWIASDENWMTARVIVNRIWLHYFGRGIVRSPNNFGLMGDPPTHPELLDYLATELIRSDWSLKHIHQLILMSSTYRRSTQAIADSLAADPTNNLFWRQNLKRMSAEQVRDSVLHVSGQLNNALLGKPIYPTLSAEVLASQSQPGHNWEKSTPENQARRSVYIHVKRSLPVPLLSVFDFPDTDTTCEARFLTVQPGQALTMLNSQWMQEQSQNLLDRVEREVGSDTQKQAARCLELTQSQPGTAADIAELVDLVQRLQSQEGMSEGLAKRYMALVALNSNQFVFID
jgi:Protein of unknown function (DUF1553)/Protein of unknown function (DUF1549)/Planctomycete cytochrome C